jgi:hypothetical protein
MLSEASERRPGKPVRKTSFQGWDQPILKAEIARKCSTEVIVGKRARFCEGVISGKKSGRGAEESLSAEEEVSRSDDSENFDKTSQDAGTRVQDSEKLLSKVEKDRFSDSSEEARTPRKPKVDPTA